MGWQGRCSFIGKAVAIELVFPMRRMCYILHDFGGAENRFRRMLEEESPNTTGRDAA